LSTDPGLRTRIHAAICALADGDRSALPLLMQDLWPVLLRFSERAVRNTADAEDIAQEVFVRIAARISDFDSSRDGLSWAFAIAAFEIRTLLKRRQRRREVSAEGELALLADFGGSSPELQVLDEELNRVLQEVATSLSPQERQALGINDSTDGVAISAPALRKRRQRALAKLKSVWKALHG
jgi:RNA polymerase sigma-70 factor (ECF subfamily)